MNGRLVQQQDCRNAALLVARRLTDARAGDVEPISNDLDPHTGWLSIDVINILGAATLGLHVAEAATSSNHFLAEKRGAALVNWNNQHWTLFQFEHDASAWVHTNSICGDGAHRGRTRCSSVAEAAHLLEAIEHQCGGYSLHRITHSIAEGGPRFFGGRGFPADGGPGSD